MMSAAVIFIFFIFGLAGGFIGMDIFFICRNPPRRSSEKENRGVLWQEVEGLLSLLLSFS